MHSIGFIVRGGPEQPRKLCDWAKAFEACAECAEMAPHGTEGYLSMFTYGPDFEAHMAAHSTPKGFEGATGGPYVWLDFDGPEALDDVRRLCVHWESWVDASTPPPLVFFSGNKGYHVGIDAALMNATPGPAFHHTARAFAATLAAQAGASRTLDTAIYDRVRLFRAPNSRHPKTGLCKVWLEADGLTRITEGQIRERARNPHPFEVPEAPPLDMRLAGLWNAATHEATQARARQTERKEAAAQGDARLNPSTLHFLRDGAKEGERSLRLFQAAANLTECGAPARLVSMLLEDTARHIGLPPVEIHRQIECGIAHGGRGHG